MSSCPPRLGSTNHDMSTTLRTYMLTVHDVVIRHTAVDMSTSASCFESPCTLTRCGVFRHYCKIIAKCAVNGARDGAFVQFEWLWMRLGLELVVLLGVCCSCWPFGCQSIHLQ